MAKLIPNSFSVYQLTQDEEIEGSKLTITQKQCIQNLLAAKSEELLSLKLDPEHPQYFIQEQAHLQGYIAALDSLLVLSQNTEQLELDLINYSN